MNEIMSIAVLAYRSAKYNDAIDLLLQTLQEDKENWLAWFYLGMSYGNSGQTDKAHRIFRIVAGSCPDEQLRVQAKAALPALQATLTKKESAQAKKQKQPIGRISIG